ncbi:MULTISPECIES: SCO6745 family protein [unclassified Streptomyces]|uniref:SCO6745 family protein n=1 Tax=Streptomyces sp. NPDC023588 TaxID=3154907 RepID=UPI0033D23A5F
MTLPPLAARHCWHAAINPLHSTIYFSPDTAKEFAALGITDPVAVNLAHRSAAMGAVGAGVVTAAFYNYRHDLVARHLPAVWDTATPEQALAARLRTADSTLRRLLGAETIASPELAEAADLAMRATEGCTRHARPLYAAHADLPVPEEPHLRLWHATTLLREHRGDGHLAALLLADLDPLEALVSHTATGKGMTPKWLKAIRGWEQSDLDAAAERLRERGILDADGELTEEGKAVRGRLEADTDRLDAAPYEHLGEQGLARLHELGGGLVMKAFAAGAFPQDLLGKR